MTAQEHLTALCKTLTALQDYIQEQVKSRPPRPLPEDYTSPEDWLRDANDWNEVWLVAGPQRVVGHAIETCREGLRLCDVLQEYMEESASAERRCASCERDCDRLRCLCCLCAHTRVRCDNCSGRYNNSTECLNCLSGYCPEHNVGMPAQ